MGQEEIRVKRLRYAVLQIFGASCKLHARADGAAIKGRNMNLEERPLHIPKGLRGDLCIQLPKIIIFVTANRGGGVAHLANCWQYVELNWDLITETVVLFYIFLAPPSDVIKARQAIWNFTLGNVKHALGNRFEAFFAACERPPNLDCHTDVPDEVIAQCHAQLEEQGILVQFRKFLKRNPPNQMMVINSPKDLRGKTPRRTASGRGGD